MYKRVNQGTRIEKKQAVQTAVMGWVGLDSVQLRSLRLNREINMRAAHFIKIHIHLFIVAKRVNSFITAAALNQIRAFHSHFAAIYELQNEK